MGRRRSLLQLVCGQVAAFIIVAGLPAAWILGLFGRLTAAQTLVITLLLLQTVSLAGQYSLNARWTPRSWLLGMTVALAILDASSILWFVDRAAYSFALLATLLAGIAAHLTFRGFVNRRIDSDDRDQLPPTSSNSSADFTSEGDLTMMEF